MSEVVPVRALTDMIQASLAPVFLFVGIGMLLKSMSARLARVVDRYRWLISQASNTSSKIAKNKREIGILARRIHLISWVIGSFSFSGLLICFIVSSLFSRTVFEIYIDASIIAMLFISSMSMIAVGLIFFLREITLSATSLIEKELEKQP